MTQPEMITCEHCDGAGCRKCFGRGKVWSDGVQVRDALCVPGQVCDRFVQCADCPYKEEQAAWKEAE